jgi:hypothetical protein
LLQSGRQLSRSAAAALAREGGGSMLTLRQHDSYLMVAIVVA